MILRSGDEQENNVNCSLHDLLDPSDFDAYSSGHMVPSLWDLHMFYLLRPILFRTCRNFTGLCSSNIPRYFLDFALRVNKRLVFSMFIADKNNFFQHATWSIRSIRLVCLIHLVCIKIWRKEKQFDFICSAFDEYLSVPGFKKTL